MGLAAGIGMLTQGGLSLYQFIKARQMEKRSKGLQGMEVPNEYNQNLALAKRMAMEGMPEESYRAQGDAINRNQAYGVRQLQTGRNQAGGIANIVANSNRANQGLNAQDANMRVNNQRGVMSARQILAQAKQRAFDQEQQAIASLRGAGIQNIGRAVDIGVTQGLMNEGQGDDGYLERLIKHRNAMKNQNLKETMRFRGSSINASPTDEYIG